MPLILRIHSYIAKTTILKLTPDDIAPQICLKFSAHNNKGNNTTTINYCSYCKSN